ncbi:MAG: hypothetical protein K2H02_03685 [Anaeroplasmataceae bacterium]|nr:hypothetical protein [Anaeroplasmataceae bacterium]
MNNSVFEHYNQTRAELKELSRKRENTIFTLIVSFLWALLIVIGPVVVLINCFVFIDYLMLIFVGVFACFMVLIYLTRLFYFQAISQGEIQGMYLFHMIDGMIVLIITLFISLAIYFLL